MTCRAYPVGALVALLITLMAAAAQADDKAQILIGGKPVELPGTTPCVLSKDVCVPVRPLAEALGANVNWDGSSGTLTVRAASNVGVLRLGSRSATINGIQVHFPYAPYLYQGQFHAPILFFNEMFDQAWVYDPLTQEFRWIPIFPRYRGYSAPRVIYGPGRRTPEPEAAPIPAAKVVVGEAVRVVPSRTSPKITIMAAGKKSTYAVAGDAIVLRGSTGGRAVEVSLGDIRPGDRATLRFGDEDAVVSIRAEYRVASGRIRALAGSTILLESGETLRVTTGTRIVLAGNITGEAQDIRTGDVIIAQVSPITSKTYILKVLPPPDGERPPEDQIALNTLGPLRAGDVLIVRFEGKIGGQAWFTIPGVRANVPMTEVEPGRYRGEYTVRPGDLLIRQPIKITFTEEAGETYTRLSRPVTIRTVAGYLPRIISPRQGEEIASPAVVRGIAEPGALVRVTVEYRADLQNILPIEGTTAFEEIKADKDGMWQTAPLPISAPFLERDGELPLDLGILFRFDEEPPTVYRITAASIGADGEEQAAYSIEVTRKPARTLGGAIPSLVELNAS